MNTYLRTWALDDISIARSGDGRTVTAYAAVFDAPYEVRDQHGHYMESIDRSAFNRTLNNGGVSRVACLYNHGLTAYGTPDMLGSVPLGTPLEIKPDGRGLLTVTRYNRSAMADAVLEAVRNGDIRSQSFRGRVFRSTPTRPPRTAGGALPTVVRHELGLDDYGPTLTPVNKEPMIVAVRSTAQLAAELGQLDDDARRELLDELRRHLAPTDSPTPDEAAGTETATPADAGPGAEDPPTVGHSGRLAIRRNAMRAELIRLGVIKP